MRATIIGLILAFGATPVLADSASPWSFGGSIGYDIPVGGSVFSAADSASLNLTALNPALSGTGVLRLRGTDYKDGYDNAVRGVIEVRYATSQSSEFFGALSYTQAKGKNGAVIGCLDTAGACTTNLTANLTDFKQTGLELGYRQWLSAGMLGDAIRPYFAIRGGVAKTEAINVLVTAGSDDLANWRLYKETYTYSIGGDIGATIAISPNAELGGEVGIRYHTDLKDQDLDFGAIGLGATNNKSERLSVPVSFRLNAAF
jgi:hypothetical protein